MPNRDWTWPFGQWTWTWRKIGSCINKEEINNSVNENISSEDVVANQAFWLRNWQGRCQWLWRNWNARWNWLWRRCCGKKF